MARNPLQFFRPHTLIVTVLCVLAMYALSNAPTALGIPASVAVLGATVVAALAANIYVVGLNQIADVDIDRINKPFLPLAAGEMNMPTARSVVAITGTCAVVLAAWLGVWMLAAIGGAMAIGTAYSVPPLHLKRSAFASAAAIGLVRGPIVNLGVFAHFQSQAGSAPLPTPAVLLLTMAVTSFGVAVAVAKDVPDEAGDRAFGVGTLTVRRGPRIALVTSVGVLAGGLVLVSLAAGLALSPGQAFGVAATQAAILTGLALLVRRAVAGDWATSGRLSSDLVAADRLTPAHETAAHETAAHRTALSKEASGRFYRGLWRLLYAEYVVLPLVLMAGSGVR